MEKELIFIDDDPIINMLHSRLAKKFSNYTVQAFLSGASALEYFQGQEDKYFIIFLDINMPEMTGWEFLELFLSKKKRFAYKIFILSSSIDRSDKEKAASIAEVSGYLEKPLIDNNLSQVVL